MEVVLVSPEQKELFRAAAQPAVREYIVSDIGSEWPDRRGCRSLTQQIMQVSVLSHAQRRLTGVLQMPTEVQTQEADDQSLTPYQLPFPPEAGHEIVVPNAVPEDERVWVRQSENVAFRPLCLNASQGYWTNLLRVRKSGVLSRHRHPQGVHGWVLKGRWHYLEHDWFAEEGGYVYEPPGETHTLVVPEGVTEMITYFQVNGVMIYVDPWGKTMGFEDVFTKIEMCRKHYEEVGLGADYVDQFIR